MLDLTLEYGSYYSVDTDAFFGECGFKPNDFGTEHARAWLDERAYTEYSYADSDTAAAWLQSIGFKSNEIRSMNFNEDSPMDQNYWFTYAMQWDRAVLIVHGEGYHSYRRTSVDVWTSDATQTDLDSMFCYWASLYCLRCREAFDLEWNGGFTHEGHGPVGESWYAVDDNQRWGKTRCPLPGQGSHKRCNGELVGSIHAND